MSGRSPSSVPPTSPVLLRTLTSAVVTDGGGDVSLPREARGAIDDWGGVYGQLVRLTGRWCVELFDGARAWALGGSAASVARAGERFGTVHRLGRTTVRQEIAPLASPAGAIRRLWISVAEGPPLRLVVQSAFVPYLLPTMVEGIRPGTHRVATTDDGVVVRQRGFALELWTRPNPSRLYLNRSSWIGGRYAGPLDEVGADHDVVVRPGEEVEIAYAIAGGIERDLARSDPRLAAAAGGAEAALARADAAESAWLRGTPELAFPDAPELERAYRVARAGLRRLYAAPAEGITGLVAGYPWYASIWCRDLAWMLPAVVWLGDFDWAERSIDSVLRFQARGSLPLLGGSPGELPMQLSPGPVFLYGTADTTLYFPAIAEQWRRHTGNPGPPRRWWPAIARIVDWGLARADPASGLVRHGGEAEAISSATGEIGRIRYGIDAPDTTIWDSADRRECAIDVQVLWRGALEAIGALEPPDAGGRERARCAALRDRLAATIARAYDWPAEQYLYDSLRNGGPVAKLRPNALRAVSAGLLAPERARAVVARAATDDLTTPWGVRTLSARDPAYRPDAYHDGQVWPIATAWAADAAFAAGLPELGRSYLDRIAARLGAEGGGANECYRGDRPEAFDSCFLLGLSLGPFLGVLFERLWGLRPDAGAGRLEVAPCFPANWRSAALLGLRVGSGTVDLRYDAPSLVVRWSGPGPLTVAAPGRSSVVPPTGTTTLPLGPAGR